MKELDEQKFKLSNDVIIDILKRMSATSLIRLKCLSRTWYSLINNSDFIFVHYNYDSISNHFILFKRYITIEKSIESVYYKGKNILSFHSNDELFNCIAPNIEHHDNYIGVKIVGPCNGIICISSYRNIILYNSILKESWKLPPSILLPSHLSSDGKKLNYSVHMNIGIGFDSNTNDYKVVRIQTFNDECLYENYDNYYMYVSKVEVYNLSTNCWSQIEDLKCTVESFYYSPVLFNGAFHWHAYMEIEDNCIISFNFSSESFTNISYPEGLADKKKKYTSLFVLYKTLALICFVKTFYEEDIHEQSIDIWVMKIYGMSESWIKEFVVGPLFIYGPLAIWLNDTELMFESYNGKLMSCNFRSQETKDFDRFGVAGTLDVVVCKESLISIKNEREKWS